MRRVFPLHYFFLHLPHFRALEYAGEIVYNIKSRKSGRKLMRASPWRFEYYNVLFFVFIFANFNGGMRRES